MTKNRLDDINFEESFKSKMNDSNEAFKSSIKNNNKKISKIYPINHQTLIEKKVNPTVKSNFTKQLNKELSRISNIYGKEKALGKFTINPVADRHYENRNYYAYEIAKQSELQNVNFKPKLQPLVKKEQSMSIMTKNLFYLKDMKKTIRPIN